MTDDTKFTIAVQALHAEWTHTPNLSVARIGPAGVAQIARLYRLARLSLAAGGEEIHAMPVAGEEGGISVEWFGSLSPETAGAMDARVFPCSTDGDGLFVSDFLGDGDSPFETDSDVRMTVSPEGFGFFLDGSMEEAKTVRIHWNRVPGLKEAIEESLRRPAEQDGLNFDWRVRMAREDEEAGSIPTVSPWAAKAETSSQEAKESEEIDDATRTGRLPVGTKLLSARGMYGPGGPDGEDTHTGPNAVGTVTEFDPRNWSYILQFGPENGEVTAYVYADDLADDLANGNCAVLEVPPPVPAAFPLGTKVVSLLGETYDPEDGGPYRHTGRHAEGFIEEENEPGSYAVRFFLPDGKGFIVFLDADDLSDPQSYMTGPPGQKNRPKHAVGTKVVSLAGEQADFGDGGGEGMEIVSIEPDALGTITNAFNLPNGTVSYQVSFPHGIARSILESELADQARYLVGTATNKYPPGMKVFSANGEWTDFKNLYDEDKEDKHTGPNAIGVVISASESGIFAAKDEPGWCYVKFQPHDVVIRMEEREFEGRDGSPYCAGHEAVLAYKQARQPCYLLATTEGSNIHSDNRPAYALVRFESVGLALLADVADAARRLDDGRMKTDRGHEIASAAAEGNGISVKWLEAIDRDALPEDVTVHPDLAPFNDLDYKDTLFEEDIRDLRVESDGEDFWVRGWVGEEDFIRSTPISLEGFGLFATADPTPSSVKIEARPAIIAVPDDRGFVDLREAGHPDLLEDGTETDGPGML